MGAIKKVLASTKLPDRELHNSRLFVDLSENVHIHFRELRSVYSVFEFFEYADIVARSAKDLKYFLKWHPEYKEQKIFDNVIVALGPEQQTTPLRNSPKPHQSTYFHNCLQIELQGEKVIDEIHIHYRDFRLVMNQDMFRIFAETMNDALEALDDFLTHNKYERIEHPFRKDVVKDIYYEAREWKKLEGNKITLFDRIKAILFYLGGEKLVRVVGKIVRRFHL